jgi:hypothetical protein
MVTSIAHKDAQRGDDSWSMTLLDTDQGTRISIYHWHGQDYESVEFGGTADDFNQFDELDPTAWFGIAAKMIAKKGEK